MISESKATIQTRARYERLAPIYDRISAGNERRLQPAYARLWREVQGPKVLEVGVGTGRQIPFYPAGVRVTAIDLSPSMLARASQRASQLGVQVNLRLGDVQALDFSDGSFDEAVAVCVFCSVPDPLLGFQELARVVKPGGHVRLLEHVRSARPLVAFFMDVLNPLHVRLKGSNINRRTDETVAQCGLLLERIEDLDRFGIFKLILARTPQCRPEGATSAVSRSGNLASSRVPVLPGV
ncbi:MAG TPA: class I SAM-dependent methyltransferase [Anaerolineae bacterium]